MVSGNDCHVFLPHGAEQFRNSPVQLRQCRGVTLRVIAMPVEHVKVHQIGEDQTFLRRAQQV
ncbi:MAG: hypothetical protein A4E52_01512 [Pelotomaculum sp. PtaB.Bin013]|nr:MAG: hypothetical protein A4E52_01512 [Pelotomaculum sp. PtaB.Bin013]